MKNQYLNPATKTLELYPMLVLCASGEESTDLNNGDIQKQAALAPKIP